MDFKMHGELAFRVESVNGNSIFARRGRAETIPCHVTALCSTLGNIPTIVIRIGILGTDLLYQQPPPSLHIVSRLAIVKV